MTYSQLTTKLINKNFYRVAKDDRLLDIFPKESRAKGIELWEKIDRQNTTIIRVHEPQSINKISHHPHYPHQRPRTSPAKQPNSQPIIISCPLTASLVVDH